MHGIKKISPVPARVKFKMLSQTATVPTQWHPLKSKNVGPKSQGAEGKWQQASSNNTLD